MPQNTAALIKALRTGLLARDGLLLRSSRCTGGSFYYLSTRKKRHCKFAGLIFPAQRHSLHAAARWGAHSTLLPGEEGSLNVNRPPHGTPHFSSDRLLLLSEAQPSISDWYLSISALPDDWKWRKRRNRSMFPYILADTSLQSPVSRHLWNWGRPRPSACWGAAILGRRHDRWVWLQLLG